MHVVKGIDELILLFLKCIGYIRHDILLNTALQGRSAVVAGIGF